MDGVYFAAVLAKPDFREHLIEHLKTWVSHLLLYTVQPQHVGVVLSRGDASRTRVSLKVMVPNAGRAGVILAENRFCRASGQAQIRGDAQNFDGLKYGDAESTTWVTMVNRKVAGQPCARRRIIHGGQERSCCPWYGLLSGPMCWLASWQESLRHLRGHQHLLRALPFEATEGVCPETPGRRATCDAANREGRGAAAEAVPAGRLPTWSLWRRVLSVWTRRLLSVTEPLLPHVFARLGPRSRRVHEAALRC
ncbi:unnamed protein product [Effrenium voratum]|nr:unnamed protein product [Effrenium voratum]